MGQESMAYIKITKSSQLHKGPLQCSVGMPDIKGETEALAQQELARQYLLAGGVWKELGEAADALV